MKEFTSPNSAAELARYFLDLQKDLLPDISIEVGAHEASFSYLFKMQNPSASSWAFEANPYVYSMFKNKNELVGISYLNLSVSNKSSTVDFYVQKSHNGNRVINTLPNNSTLRRSEGGWEYETVKVQSISLDDFFLLSKRVTSLQNVCLWVDVEGASREVLTGAESLLDRVSSILIEVEHKQHWVDQWLFEDVDKFLVSKGFVATAKDSEFQHIGQNNVVYARNTISL